MHFCSMMSFNKIADLGIDYKLNHGLWNLFKVLIRVYYLLYSIGIDY